MDYSLHLAHVYDEAGHEEGVQSRTGRVKHCLLNMGPTIFAGFFSSITAGLFLMIFAQSRFFSQMGIAVTVTIVASLIMSLVYLPAVFLLIGPAREQGDVGACYRRYKSRS